MATAKAASTSANLSQVTSNLSLIATLISAAPFAATDANKLVANFKSNNPGWNGPNTSAAAVNNSSALVTAVKGVITKDNAPAAPVAAKTPAAPVAKTPAAPVAKTPAVPVAKTPVVSGAVATNPDTASLALLAAAKSGQTATVNPPATAASPVVNNSGAQQNLQQVTTILQSVAAIAAANPTAATKINGLVATYKSSFPGWNGPNTSADAVTGANTLLSNANRFAAAVVVPPLSAPAVSPTSQTVPTTPSDSVAAQTAGLNSVTTTIDNTTAASANAAATDTDASNQTIADTTAATNAGVAAANSAVQTVTTVSTTDPAGNADNTLVQQSSIDSINNVAQQISLLNGSAYSPVDTTAFDDDAAAQNYLANLQAELTQLQAAAQTSSANTSATAAAAGAVSSTPAVVATAAATDDPIADLMADVPGGGLTIAAVIGILLFLL